MKNKITIVVSRKDKINVKKKKKKEEEKKKSITSRTLGPYRCPGIRLKGRFFPVSNKKLTTAIPRILSN